MRRFYIEDLTEDSHRIEVRGEEFRHMSKVLRLREGAVVTLFNGAGLELTARLDVMRKDHAEVLTGALTWRQRESALRTALIVGLVKGEKPEFIIQKATELGVTEITFYAADRSVPTDDVDRAGSRLSRWRRVAIESAKQCGRTVLPRIALAPDMASAVKGLDKMQRLMLWESEKKKRLKDVLKDPAGADGVAMLIGPEGGFTEQEVEAAKDNGFVSVSLGPRTLRAETAAIAILAIIQQAHGDMK